MRIKNLPIIVLTILILLLISSYPVLSSETGPDNGVYAELLKAYVMNGRVDYKGFKEKEDLLDKYLEALSSIDPETLDKKHRFALYINAYNAWTIKLILSAYPDVSSIKDLGSFFQTPWKKKLPVINGVKVTLDYIEHEVIRPVFKDPRAHFAVNCASKSCPPLLSEPYEGDKLNDQLNAAAKAFINNSNSNYLKDGTLYVSRIFKWFSEDFGDDVIGFFLKYADENLKEGILKNKDALTISYLDYDWSLNGK